MGSGFAMVYDNDGNIYASGYVSKQHVFYKYSIASNTWTQMSSAPDSFSTGNGGSLAYDNNGNIYAIGGSTNTQALYKYSISSNLSPSLSSVTINYTNYPTSQTLTSSPYNSTDPGDVLAKIQWTATTPTNTGVKFQVRTAPDNGSGAPGTWSSWVGPDGTSNSYFTDSTGGQTMPTLTSTNSQWIQYQATLTSDGFSGTPTVSNVTMTYVVNAPPVVSGVTASEGSTGQVAIKYSVTDSDTSTDVNPGYVSVNLQYCDSNVSGSNCVNPSANDPGWTTAKTITGDPNSTTETVDSTTGTISNISADGSQHAITWDSKTDYPNQYNASLKIRIVANDGEIANNLAYGDASLILDTTNPVFSATPFTIDHSSDTLNINTINDNSSYQLYISNDPNFQDSSTVGPISYPTGGKYTDSNLTNDPSTVYIKAVDAYGNSTVASAVTPAQPQNLLFYDTSNTSTSDYREFIAWGAVSNSQVGSGFAGYKVWRSTDGGKTFSLLATVTNQAQN